MGRTEASDAGLVWEGQACLVGAFQLGGMNPVEPLGGAWAASILRRRSLGVVPGRAGVGRGPWWMLTLPSGLLESENTAGVLESAVSKQPPASSGRRVLETWLVRIEKCSECVE